MLKILHVNYSDIRGGAAIGVNRLHKALKKKNIKSSILVAEKISANNDVIGPKSTLEIIKFLCLKSLARILKKYVLKSNEKETYSFNLLNTNILKKINNFDCDIVHLHWIGNEMISVKQINKINKPIVWTFWDMWPFCSVEHYVSDDRYAIKNYKNNLIKGLDLSKLTLNHKKKLRKDIVIISPSKWMTKCINKSLLFKSFNLLEIPYNLDVNFWRPIDKNFSKELFDIPKNKIILLFGSATSVNDRKGFDFLVEFFKKFRISDDICLVIFGLKPKNLDKLKVNYQYIGELNDKNSLKAIYSASDILIMPSQFEAFGQICSEATSCELPSIIFDDTGMIDFIEHKINGFIVKKMNLDSFKKGIDWCLDKNNLEFISLNTRKKIINFCDDKTISDKYINLYKSLL